MEVTGKGTLEAFYESHSLLSELGLGRDVQEVLHAERGEIWG